MPKFSLDALDLAALLSSRVCHDVISPVGAIINGLEVLEDEKDAEMRGHALDLIKSSASEASSRLQFCRLAFGAAGSKGAAIDTGDAEGDEISFRVEAKGPNARLAPEVVRLLSGESDEATLDARAIQAYYAGLVAEACELEVAASGGGDAIVIEAKPKVLPTAEELSAPESAVA